MESRVVTVHVSEGESVKIPAATSMGGGLNEEHRAALARGEDAKIIKGAICVTVATKGKGVLTFVKTVEYEEKKLSPHDPIF